MPAGAAAGQGEIHEPARAKVNLYLRVTGRRPDGYHLLDSAAAFPAVGDLVTADRADTLSLTVDGPFGGQLAADGDNLVWRAATGLAARLGRPPGARLHLHKVLPVASGIGGGSADAAATLRALGRLWGAPREDLLAVAATLGADVPMCLASEPVFVSGIGEVLAPCPLPPCALVLATPGVPVATADVFGARSGPYAAAPPRWERAPDSAAALADLLATRPNDLTRPAVALAPVILEVLAALAPLPGCHLARMSGSGATCFGLFDDLAAAESGAAALLARHPAWWVVAAALAAPVAAPLAGLPPDARP